jgi:hypothetical protein
MKSTWRRDRRPGRHVRIAAAAAVVLAAGTAAADPEVGAWTEAEEWPVGATHSILLATGQVLFFGEFDYGDMAHLYDPATGKLTPLGQAGYNIFCAGHSPLADGRVLVAGGHIDSHVGEQHSVLFDPLANTWTRTPDMWAGRWYPTNTTLPNGEIVVVSGEMTDSGENNPIPEVWQPATGTWRLLTGANFEIDYYPRQFLAPNGQVFIATPKAQSYWLDTTGTGSMLPGTMQLAVGRRTYGGAVMYERGKILVVGGADPPTATAEVIDLNEANPTWRATSPLDTPRRQHNTTLLPDGTVLVTGGSSGGGFNNRSAPVYPAVNWDPKTETWTTWASNSVFRGYHSTAVLLPDGRVLVGGGRGKGDYTGQTFSPPYLFKGTRPEITSVPARAGYGGPFEVNTPNPAAIARVTLLAPGAMTHAFDQHARFLELSFTPTATGLRINAPENANLAPPGYYMLFLLDGNGVPSEGKFVQIGGEAGPPGDSVTVVAPNGGELLSPGAMTHISWGLTGAVSAVDIDFSPDAGGSWTTLAENVPADPPHYDWHVPEELTTQGVVRVRMAGSQDIIDQSDSPFIIGVQWEGLPFGSTWRYLDDDADPGEGWNTTGFDDSGWAEGPAPLGYGDGNEATVLAKTVPSQHSVYFRRTIDLPGQPTAAAVTLRFDDGYALWVNGTLVSQRHMDRGLAHGVYASATAENLTATDNVPAEAFVPGENVLAVMVKQIGPSSNDLTFDLDLRMVGGAEGEGGAGGSGGHGGGPGHGGAGGGGGSGGGSVVVDPLEPGDSGCSCSNAGSGGATALALGLVALALRRRRARGEADDPDASAP